MYVVARGVVITMSDFLSSLGSFTKLSSASRASLYLPARMCTIAIPSLQPTLDVKNRTDKSNEGTNYDRAPHLRRVEPTLGESPAERAKICRKTANTSNLDQPSETQ